MYKIIPCKVPAGNNPVRDYSSVETFDCTATRMTSVMRTNSASLRDAGEGGERYFLPNFASLRDAGSPFTVHRSPFTVHRSSFTVHHKSLIFDKSGCTKPYRVKYNTM
ncbi:MAG: hypothetical protein LBG45_10490 [Dysgonamonadaceae bacterium]|nr:hypothetical protein [Dysgonamonadaceae bacterium]